MLPEFASPKSSVMPKDRGLGERYLLRSCMDFPERETWIGYGVENCQVLIEYLRDRNDPRLEAAREKLSVLETHLRM